MLCSIDEICHVFFLWKHSISSWTRYQWQKTIIFNLIWRVYWLHEVFFICKCKKNWVLGYLVLGVWLAALLALLDLCCSFFLVIDSEKIRLASSCCVCLWIHSESTSCFFAFSILKVKLTIVWSHWQQLYRQNIQQ
jgi:hypothetical protein